MGGLIYLYISTQKRLTEKQTNTNRFKNLKIFFRWKENMEKIFLQTYNLFLKYNKFETFKSLRNMSKELVLSVLKNSDKPMKTAEIAAAAGLDKKEVEKALKALRSEQKIFSPKNCFYQAK